jgi:hypothetical protein
MNSELSTLVRTIKSSDMFASIGKQNQTAFTNLIDALVLQGNDGITPMSVYPEVPYYSFCSKKNQVFRHRLLERPTQGEAWTPPSTEESYGLSDVKYAKLVFGVLLADYVKSM